jgi:LPXTG-motif cell wall-anchored protein
VTFSDGAAVIGGPVALDGSGQATFTTPALSVGSHQITAVFAETATHATSSGSVEQVVSRATTQTVLESSLNPSTFGESVTFTATVTITDGPSSGQPAVGAVTFTDGATALGGPVTLDGTGRATFTTSAFTPGTHSVTASYGGGIETAASSDTLGQVVDEATSSTVLTSSVNPSIDGAAVTFTAMVTITSGPLAGQPASGAVVFDIDGTDIGAVLVAGQATIIGPVALLGVGTHTVLATYQSADGVAGSVSAPLQQVVVPAASATVLTSSLNPSTFGDSVTLTATVTYTDGPNAGTEVATGVITVTDTTTGTVLGTSGSGSPVVVSVSTLAVGTHTITAEYSGTPGIDPSSDSLDQVVDGVADAGGPYTIDEGEGLVLDGTASLAGPGATYRWDLDGDGEFDDATGATPTVAWAALEALGFDGDDPPAGRTVTLQLTDGPVFTAVSSLTIANVAPTAVSLDAPVSAAEGSSPTVTVDASDPSGIDEADLEYRFDFGADGTVDLTSDTASVQVPASFLPDGPGTLDIRAVVADPDGGVSAAVTASIAVTNASAAATIVGPSRAVVGEPVTIKVGAVDPGAVDMLGTFMFRVDWGDGTPPVTLPGPADPPVTHTYTAAGVYTVVAVVTDPDGTVGEPLEFTMTVVEQIPPPTTIAPTTTEAVRSTTTAAPTTTLAGDLPSTGAGTSNLAFVASALLGAGIATIFAGRKVRSWTTHLDDPGP